MCRWATTGVTVELAKEVVIAAPESTSITKRAAFPLGVLVMVLAIVAVVAVRADGPHEDPTTMVGASASASATGGEGRERAVPATTTSTVERDGRPDVGVASTRAPDVPSTTHNAAAPATTTPRRGPAARPVPDPPATDAPLVVAPTSSIVSVTSTSTVPTVVTSPSSTTTTTVPPRVSFSITPSEIDNDMLRYGDRPTLAWDVTPSAGFSVTVRGIDDGPWPSRGQAFSTDWPSGVRLVCPGSLVIFQTATLCGPTLGDFDYTITVRDAAGTIVASQTVTLRITPVFPGS